MIRGTACLNANGPCPDGTRIVTASLDSTGRLWDAATGKPIGESLGGHESYVLGAAFSPDGKRVVTA